MSAQSNKSTATLPIFFKLSSDLFEKSWIAPEFFSQFLGLGVISETPYKSKS